MASAQEPSTPNPDGLPAQAIIETLSKCLTEIQATDKAPRGLDEALNSLPSDGISRAFQAAGFWVWFAYFLATSRDESLEQSTSQLSSPTLQYVVGEVSKVNAHASLVRRIQNAFFSSNRAAKRCKLLQLNNIGLPNPPPSPEPPSPEPNPPKRPRLERVQQSPYQQADTTGLLNSHFANADVMTQGDVSDALSRRSPCQQDTGLARPNKACEAPAFDIDPRYQYAYPKAKNLPFVFPHYMCTTIVKRDYEASLMLSFPLDPTLCRFVFDISATEVQHLAMQLFGVRIREENGRRCAVFENGATMVIIGSVKLEDTTAVAWDTILGELVSTAVRHSPGRMDELSQGALLSKCLSMEIPAAVDRPARLSLMVDAEKISLVHDQLWMP